jgi:prepilin peptidase CpaA
MTAPQHYDLIPLAALALLLLAAAVGDARRYLIPNWISIAVAALYPLYILLHPEAVDWAAGIAVALGLFGFGFVLHLLGVIGGGDVKLLAAAGLWAGPQYLVPLLLIMALSGGVLALVLMIARASRVRVRHLRAGPTRGHGQLPYGVAIAAGGMTVSVLLAAG